MDMYRHISEAERSSIYFPMSKIVDGIEPLTLDQILSLNMNSDKLESTKGFRPIESPLELPHILERITSYLGIQDIRSLRLVNRFFSQEILKIAKSRKPLWTSDSDVKEAEMFIKRKTSGSNIQLSKLCISTSQPLHKHTIFKSVMNLFGMTLRRLQLTDYSNESLTSSTLYSILAEGSPNLEEIATHVRPSDLTAFQSQRTRQSILTEMRKVHPDCIFPKIYSLELDEGCNINLMDISSMFPNVRKLEVSRLILPENGKGSVGQVWQSLSSLNLLYLSVTPGILNFFESLALQLKVFVLSQSTTSKANSKSASLALTSFLKSISSTLNDLRITPTCGLMTVACHLKVVLPLLPELTKLDIMFQSYESFNMLEQTPKLKKFVSGFHDPSVSQLDPTRHSLIKNCHIEYASLGAADLYFMEKFSAVCSKLEELWIHPSHVDDRTFRAIIVGFPHLRRLSICDLWGAGTFFSGRMAENNSVVFSDSAITGIPARDLDNLNCESTVEEIEKVRKYPFIGDLKRLTELSLEGRTNPLSDKSFLFGVRFLSSLNAVSVRNASKISQETITSLLNHNENIKGVSINGSPMLRNVTSLVGAPSRWTPVDKWHLSSISVTIDTNLHYFKPFQKRSVVAKPQKRRAVVVFSSQSKRFRFKSVL